MAPSLMKPEVKYQPQWPEKRHRCRVVYVGTTVRGLQAPTLAWKGRVKWQPKLMEVIPEHVAIRWQWPAKARAAHCTNKSCSLQVHPAEERSEHRLAGHGDSQRLRRGLQGVQRRRKFQRTEDHRKSATSGGQPQDPQRQCRRIDAFRATGFQKATSRTTRCSRNQARSRPGNRGARWWLAFWLGRICMTSEYAVRWPITHGILPDLGDLVPKWTHSILYADDFCSEWEAAARATELATCPKMRPGGLRSYSSAWQLSTEACGTSFRFVQFASWCLTRLWRWHPNVQHDRACRFAFHPCQTMVHCSALYRIRSFIGVILLFTWCCGWCVYVVWLFSSAWHCFHALRPVAIRCLLVRPCWFPGKQCPYELAHSDFALARLSTDASRTALAPTMHPSDVPTPWSQPQHPFRIRSLLMHLSPFVCRQTEDMLRNLPAQFQTNPVRIVQGVLVRTWFLHHVTSPSSMQFRQLVLRGPPHHWHAQVTSVQADRLVPAEAVTIDIVRPNPPRNWHETSIISIWFLLRASIQDVSQDWFRFADIHRLKSSHACSCSLVCTRYISGMDVITHAGLAESCQRFDCVVLHDSNQIPIDNPIVHQMHHGHGFIVYLSQPPDHQPAMVGPPAMPEHSRCARRCSNASCPTGHDQPLPPNPSQPPDPGNHPEQRRGSPFIVWTGPQFLCGCDVVRMPSCSKIFWHLLLFRLLTWLLFILIGQTHCEGPHEQSLIFKNRVICPQDPLTSWSWLMLCFISRVMLSMHLRPCNLIEECSKFLTLSPDRVCCTSFVLPTIANFGIILACGRQSCHLVLAKSCSLGRWSMALSCECRFLRPLLLVWKPVVQFHSLKPLRTSRIRPLIKSIRTCRLIPIAVCRIALRLLLLLPMSCMIV